MSPCFWAIIIGTMRLVRSTMPNTFVSNCLRMALTSSEPISAG